jgi:hypothetical protein
MKVAVTSVSNDWFGEGTSGGLHGSAEDVSAAIFFRLVEPLIKKENARAESRSPFGVTESVLGIHPYEIAAGLFIGRYFVRL